MPLLSIYIPTWNRPHLLDRLLCSIEPQLIDELDVFVSINKSDVDYKLPPWVSFRTTRINIGGDANIITGPTLVTGKYVWVIGDDEQLLPGAIDTTLKCIQENPGLIIHPDSHFNLGVELGNTYATYIEFCEEMLRVGNPKTITAHTLISSNTFQRNKYDVSLATQKLDSRYGFHYAMLSNLFFLPVKIADCPTMIYGNEASIFQHDQATIKEHMDSYPKIVYDIFDWVFASTGYPIPYDAYGKGFY